MELAAVHNVPLSWLRAVHHSYENQAGSTNILFGILLFFSIQATAFFANNLSTNKYLRSLLIIAVHKTTLQNLEKIYS